MLIELNGEMFSTLNDNNQIFQLLINTFLFDIDEIFYHRNRLTHINRFSQLVQSLDQTCFSVVSSF